MKLQNLIIIFIIIIIPIVSIFTLYLNLETKTIVLQTDYDEKLIEATKEAMEAFEINTTEWYSEYSTLANYKRRNIRDSINTFTTSLSNKLGIAGTSQESILTYVPAIVYTMYDGYYIYTPTYVPQTITDDEGRQLFYYENASDNTKYTVNATQKINEKTVYGEIMYEFDSNVAGATQIGVAPTGEPFTTNKEHAKKIYKHVLKTFVPYTTEYEENSTNYIINYTLDNYIRIYGKGVEKEGYIIDNFYSDSGCRLTIPINSINGIKFDDISITTETLTENVAIKNIATGEIEVKENNYIYNSSNDKRYYDSTTGEFFSVNEDYKRTNLSQATVGERNAEYKKLLVLQNNFEYIELYQLINSTDTTWYYINSNGQYIPYTSCDSSIINIGKDKDCSSINYYVENYVFNNWLDYKRFDISGIISQKNEKIIENINNNLNLSISNYSANSKIDYELPELTDQDWEQALSNISIITFFQGSKIGLKTYNNYSIVTSTHNNEMVSEDSLYYTNVASDNYYHRYNCSQGNSTTYQAYRNTEFKPKSYIDIDSNTKYYNKYNEYDEDGKLVIETYECFDCIVNRNNYIEQTDANILLAYKTTYYNAIARERYVQMQRTRLTNSSAIIKETEPLVVEHTTSTLGDNRTVALNITGGSGNYTINWKYRTSIAGLWQNAISAKNQKTYTNNKTYDVQYTVKDTVTQETFTYTVNGGTEMY